MKLCFISYARNSNLDGRLTRFVEKLQKQLPGHLPHGISPDDVVFFDVMGIDTADEWMNRLADATRLCKVCVCFYSPPYFTSEYSGREVQVFLHRVHEWSLLPENAGAQARAIIPVIWVPHEPLPAVLRPFQFGNARLPSTYVKEGLHALAMRKSRSDAYNTVLNALAIQIADTVKTVKLPDGAPIGSFDAIANAFHSATPVRYGAAVMFLTTPEKRTQPFGTGSSLDALVEALANRCRVPFREIKITGTVDLDIKASIAAREMPVLIVDRGSLKSSLNSQLIKKIAGCLDQSATALLFDAPLDNAADAAETLRTLASSKLSIWMANAGVAPCLVATDPTAFETELEKRLSKARDELIAADPARRAEDPTLEAAAEAQGILIGTQPVWGAQGV